MAGIAIQHFEGPLDSALPELIRIKSWLLVERGTVRDYTEAVSIYEALPASAVRAALARFDATHPRGPTGELPRIELVERLREAMPQDRSELELATYKDLRPPWNAWTVVANRGHAWASFIAADVLSSSDVDASLSLEILARSRALWNFDRFDPENDEALAQILDRGSLEDWRALYALLAAADEPAERLQARVEALLFRVPTGHPYFWLAALESLGRRIDPTREPKLDMGESDV